MLSPYQDGELGEIKRISVKNHLAECTDCNSAYRELEDIKNMVSGMREIEPDSAFNAKIMGKIGETRTYFGKLIGNLAYSFIFFIFFSLGAYFYLIPEYSNRGFEKSLSFSSEILKSQDFSVLDLDLSSFLFKGDDFHEK